MTKVLFTDVYPARHDGAQRTLADIATRLPDRFEVAAATVAEGPAAEAWRAAGLTVHLVAYPPALQAYGGELLTRNPLRSLASAIGLARHTIAAARLIRRARVDVVYCSNVRSMLSFGLAARLTRRPVVLYAQQLQDDFGSAGRLAARLASRVVSLSDQVERAFPHGVPAHRFRVIPLGIDLAAWAPAVARSEQIGPSVIACVGTVTEAKGIDVVVEALVRLRVDHDVTLRVIGATADDADDVYAADIRRRAEDAGIAGAIQWVGATDDVRSALTDVRALVSGSRREGTPRSIMEAMSLALPTVATDVGAVRDLVIDGATGYLVPPDSPDALAEAIDRLLTDPASSHRLGSAAREHALAHFDLADTVAAFAEEFEALTR